MKICSTTFTRPAFVLCVALVAIAGCSNEVKPGDRFIPGTGTPAPQSVQYTLTVGTDAPNATVGIDERGFVNRCPPPSGGPCELRYFGGEILTLTAHPPAGWRFDRWSGCEVSRSPTITIRMPKENLACRAGFFPFDDGFDLKLDPDLLAAQPGTQVASQIAIERGANFGGFPVTFALENPPVGISLLAPAAGVSTDSAALTIDVTANVNPGRYLLSLRGTAQNGSGQAVTRAVTLALDVSGPSDFHLELSAPTLSISRSTSCSLTAEAVRTDGSVSDIMFSAQDLPPGITANFSPPLVGGTPASNTTIWTLTADESAAFGEQQVVAAGQTAAKLRSAPLRLAVTAARDSCAMGSFATPPRFEDFAIALGAPTVSLPQSEITAVDITIDRSRGFTGPVSFTASGVPPGTLVKFDPPTPTAGNTKRLILITGPTAQVGTATVTITATGAGTGFALTHQATLGLVVTPGAQNCPLSAVADSFISPAISNGAPGTSGVLQVGSALLQQATKTYLAFDTRGIAPPFDRVELVMSLYTSSWAAASPNDSRAVYVWGITDNNDWDLSPLPEAAINWNNAPKNNTSSSYAFIGEGSTAADPTRHLGNIIVRSSDATRTLYRVDITDYVRWAIGLDSGFSSLAVRDTDGIVTFMLGNNRVSGVGPSDYTEFRSREMPVACDRPHLEVYQ